MSTIVVNSLIEKLEQRRIKEQLSNRQFAKKLGISAELWRLTRNGQRAISGKLTKGIVSVYPELDKDVLLFLHSDVVIISKPAGDTTNAPQRHQDGKLARFRAWFKDFFHS